MNDEELLLSVINDKILECENNSVITNTDFLDLRKQSIAVSYLKRKKGVRWLLWGGYENAERKIIIFLPYYVENFFDYIKTNKSDIPLVLFRADKDDFSSLSHRDYLGSILGLGIKREKIGDILVDEKGCFFFALPVISAYISSNLSKAGRGTLSISIKEDIEELNYTPNIKQKVCFIQSPRLDSVCSAVFSLSRSKASEFIEKGLVFVNDEQILKADHKLKVPDKIVIKGRGRAILKDDTGRSKKDRTALVVDVFI
ncbi:MAG: hypothetical protein IJU45_03355 [Clostridia bacterium]|nr:hypothetical protein [Clostridia bacterium]